MDRIGEAILGKNIIEKKKMQSELNGRSRHVHRERDMNISNRPQWRHNKHMKR